MRAAVGSVGRVEGMGGLIHTERLGEAEAPGLGVCVGGGGRHGERVRQSAGGRGKGERGEGSGCQRKKKKVKASALKRRCESASRCCSNRFCVGKPRGSPVG